MFNKYLSVKESHMDDFQKLFFFQKKLYRNRTSHVIGHMDNCMILIEQS
jgi:hypothetical protein